MSHQNSTISVNTIEPQSGTTLTIGNAGQDVVVNADSIKNNVLKDAGGNAVFTSNGSGVLSSVNSAFGAAPSLITTNTISSSVAYSQFITGIDNTYKHYLFQFFTIHPASDQASFQWQVSTDGGSSYGMTITSTGFWCYTNTSGSGAFQYSTQNQLAQSTNYQNLTYLTGNENEKCCAGELHLFNPSSTTYVKNFIARMHNYEHQDTSVDTYTAGYVNDGSNNIDAIRFKFSTGNIDAGKIKMYGIK